MGFLQTNLRISTAVKHIGYIKINTFINEKREYLPQYWPDNGFNCTVVNQALPSLHGKISSKK